MFGAEKASSLEDWNPAIVPVVYGRSSAPGAAGRRTKHSAWRCSIHPFICISSTVAQKIREVLCMLHSGILLKYANPALSRKGPSFSPLTGPQDLCEILTVCRADDGSFRILSAPLENDLNIVSSIQLEYQNPIANLVFLDPI